MILLRAMFTSINYYPQFVGKSTEISETLLVKVISTNLRRTCMAMYHPSSERTVEKLCATIYLAGNRAEFLRLAT